MKRSKASKGGKKQVRRPGAPVKRGTVSAPVAITTMQYSGKPKFTATASGGTRVRHRELASNVIFVFNDSAFKLHPLNSTIPGLDGSPGCKNLFPWLSAVADNYERYHFNKLKVELVSSMPTTASGRVYLAWDYDYDDPAATTKAGLMANRSAMESGVWSNLCLEVDCQEGHRDLRWKYCSNAKRVEPEPRTSHIGYLEIAVQGVSGTTYQWDLWVEYDVEFDIPCLEEETAVSQVTTDPIPAPYGVTVPLTGGGAGRLIDHLLPIDEGQLRLVQPGQGSIPNLSTEGTLMGGVGTVITQAFDLQHAKCHTVLQTGVDWATDGATPAANIAAKVPVVDFLIYDSKGTYWGNVANELGDAFWRIAGAAQAAAITTAGQQVRTLGNFVVGELLEKVPVARFLVACLYTSQSASAGNWRPFYSYA